MTQKGHSYLLGDSWAGSSSMGSSQRRDMLLDHFLLANDLGEERIS